MINMTRIESLLTNSKTRFISATIKTSWLGKKTFSVKVKKVTKHYVDLYIPSVGQTMRFNKSSIKRVSQGKKVASSL